jgi:RNA polymerase sigma factor (sigma-70 family)
MSRHYTLGKDRWDLVTSPEVLQAVEVSVRHWSRFLRLVDIDDIRQDAMEVVCRCCAVWDGVRPLVNLINRSIRNRMLHHYRRQHRRTMVGLSFDIFAVDGDHCPLSREDDPSSLASGRDLWRQARRYLSVDNWNILWMFVAMGHTYRTIAAVYRLSRSRIHQRVQDSLGTLRTKMGPSLGFAV